MFPICDLALYVKPKKALHVSLMDKTIPECIAYRSDKNTFLYNTNLILFFLTTSKECYVNSWCQMSLVMSEIHCVLTIINGLLVSLQAVSCCSGRSCVLTCLEFRWFSVVIVHLHKVHGELQKHAGVTGSPLEASLRTHVQLYLQSDPKYKHNPNRLDLT